MAAYRQVYDTCHLQADCQEPRSTPDPMLGYRVGATIAFFLVHVMFLECYCSKN